MTFEAGFRCSIARSTPFTLYEDEGDGYGYVQGASATVGLNWDDTALRHTLGDRVGSYPGMPEEREIVVVVHDEAARSRLDAAASSRQLCYAGKPMIVDW